MKTFEKINEETFQKIIKILQSNLAENNSFVYSVHIYDFSEIDYDFIVKNFLPEALVIDKTNIYEENFFILFKEEDIDYFKKVIENNESISFDFTADYILEDTFELKVTINVSTCDESIIGEAPVNEFYFQIIKKSLIKIKLNN